MKTAMDIIADQFPHLGGLQDTILPELKAESDLFGFQFAGGGRVAQIHHTGQHHWVLSCEVPTSGSSQAGEVALFDSLRGSSALQSDRIKQNLLTWPTLAMLPLTLYWCTSAKSRHKPAALNAEISQSRTWLRLH